MSVELKEIQESIAGLVADVQAEHKKLGETGQKNSEAMEKMEKEFITLSEQVQAADLKAKAEEKARQDLELSVSKVFESAKGNDNKGTQEYKNSFHEYTKHRTAIADEHVDNELKSMIREVSGLEVSDSDFIHIKTMLVGSNPDGGYLAPVETMSKITKRIFETSPMRSIATTVSTANEAVEMVLDDGEFSSGWVGELDSRGETDTSKLGVITIPTHEQFAQPKATQKMIDDALFNPESWISGKVADKFSRTENTAFTTGDGVKKPEGFLTLADWTTAGTYERNALETRETSTASSILADDLIDLQTDLLEFYQANASWVMARKTWAYIMKLKDAVNGNYLLNPAMMFQGSLGLQLLGKPVKLFSDMPVVDDSNVPVAYGDFREGYTVVDRMGIRILRDPYTEKGMIKFYTTKRVGAKVTNYQAIKRLKIKSA